MWVMLLMMTGGQVDRAMKLEDDLTEEWFERWKVWSEETSKVKK